MHSIKGYTNKTSKKQGYKEHNNAIGNTLQF